MQYQLNRILINLQLKRKKNLLKILVRFSADYRIKPHVPPFKQIPANSVKFQPCDCTAQAGYLRVNFNQKGLIPIV